VTGDIELEERDPGLARERSWLAYTRTAISFAALAGTVLKYNVICGLAILAIAPVVWLVAWMSRGDFFGAGLPVVGTLRIRLICASIVVVGALALVVAVLGKSVPGALR